LCHIASCGLLPWSASNVPVNAAAVTALGTVFDVAFLHRSALTRRSFSNQWVDWSVKWTGTFGSEWRRLCRGSDGEGSQQPEVQVDGGSSAPLQVSLNAAVSACSGACPAQPTVRELPVRTTRRDAWRQWPRRLACACPWRRPRGYRLAPPFVFSRLPTQRCLWERV
jgi:hypothetical protein